MTSFEKWLEKNKEKFAKEKYHTADIVVLAVNCGFSVDEVGRWAAVQ